MSFTNTMSSSPINFLFEALILGTGGTFSASLRLHSSSLSFFFRHVTGPSAARCRIHGVWVFFNTLAVKSLSPPIQVLFLQQGLVLFGVTDSQYLSPF